ncbi:MAG TPA: class I SAM-dependent methyltransferase [Steroidobacteraceae bacterium]|nr:class I SAM-dependent methyltransferase [Steroidobacteraceae bacterium]
MSAHSNVVNGKTIPLQTAFGSGSSVVIDSCQVCGNPRLQQVVFLGYLPPVNEMQSVGTVPHELPSYPVNLLYCRNCELVQLGLSIDPKVLFPPSYPYTSGTTRILRDNFAALYRESREIAGLGPNDLIVDIGSNDGTLLSNFAAQHRVLGIEPTDVGAIASGRGIPTLRRYFGKDTALQVCKEHGQAKIITAANCFAHIEDVHSVVDGVLALLAADGLFISENHYFIGVLDRLQYDTVYHEHLRYYSLRSIKYLLEMHGLEVVHAVRIPTHGGSIRVYAARRGTRPVRDSVAQMIAAEPEGEAMIERLARFRHEVLLSKLRLMAILRDIKEAGGRICGISAPSRASTLICYSGLDDGTLDYVAEVKGSLKIGKYMPGTIIPVVEEGKLFEDQPEYALILSWHIAEELMPKLREKGYRGRFIVPLPVPRLV